MKSKIAKATYIVLRIPVDINYKPGKCKYLKFEFKVYPKYKDQVVKYLKDKFSKGKFQAKVTVKYKPYKLEPIQPLQAFHNPDIGEQLKAVLLTEIQKNDFCHCGHSRNDHNEGKHTQCFWSYNCDCKEFR